MRWSMGVRSTKLVQGTHTQHRKAHIQLIKGMEGGSTLRHIRLSMQATASTGSLATALRVASHRVGKATPLMLTMAQVHPCSNAST